MTKLDGIIHQKDERPFDDLTEKDLQVLINKAKQNSLEKSSKNLLIVFGAYGRAIIHPPKHLNLPEMELNIYHFDNRNG